MGCAQVVAPTGGPEDNTPPQLDSLLSTRNYQTRFEKKTIVLAFDEWVELKDAFNQVIVSPPLEFRPEVVRKKKTIQFNFHEDEILRDSATYIINFGKAIQDITKGNPASVTYVFSTGDFIDSLSVKGQIIDAFTQAPVEDVVFLLYENLADSVFRTERPFYFARTDEDGNFEVNNMKSGKFKATALVDGNLNYLFDSDAEQVAFLDEPILVSGPEAIEIDSMSIDSLPPLPDSAQVNLLPVDSTQTDSLSDQKRRDAFTTKVPSLRLFLPHKRLFLIDDEKKKYGLVKLVFNRNLLPGEPKINFDDIGQSVFLENEKDTTRVWYASQNDEPWNIYMQVDTLFDTLKVKTGLRADFLEEATLRTANKTPNNLPVQIPGKPFSIQFNHPLASFDSTLVRFIEDSILLSFQPKMKIDSVGSRHLVFDYQWKEDSKYEFELLPNCLTDIYGLSQADTVRRSLMAGAVSDYSTLTLRVKNLRPDTAYVIRIMEGNENEYRAFNVADSSSMEVKLTLMPPGKYSIEIIEDLDRNGRWTTGNYDLKRQPERIRRASIKELLANWEVDEEVGWTEELTPIEDETGDPSNGPSGSQSGENRPNGSGRNR